MRIDQRQKDRKIERQKGRKTPRCHKTHPINIDGEDTERGRPMISMVVQRVQRGAVLPGWLAG
jgi:hypothetical protein